MPPTRSRPKTEQKFKDAVVSILASEGFAPLGISAVATEAGADKVLIYRYFKDFEGLLHAVADERRWIPGAEMLCEALPDAMVDPSRVLERIAESIRKSIRSDACLLQSMRWRQAENNAITQRVSDEWRRLWAELPDYLCVDQSSIERNAWTTALSLLALIIEDSLYASSLNHDAIAMIAEQLSPITPATADGPSRENYDRPLPTNLL